MSTPPFITFYSFKGGVGRTQAVANVGAQLASRGFRVLVVDFDLEAPGLTWLLDEPAPGLVDLLNDAKERGAQSDLFAYTPQQVLEKYSRLVPLPKDLHHPDGMLRVLPAGQRDESYGSQLQALGLGDLYENGTGRPLIAHLKQTLQSTDQLDFVLVDSRTGFSDESGICSRALAEGVLIL
jgi:MinD-like ATPase involved in chromosome partitioning or flagellar assembly